MGASHARLGHQLGSVGRGIMHDPPVKARNPGAQARIVEIFNEALGWEETDASDCVARLVEVTGLPSTLRDVGVTSNEQIEQIIDKTMTDVMFSFGKILTRKEVSEIVYSTK
ncbi:hypothetical protein CEK25_002843 [Fusarium fujikuroi]|nr:hypothetical protein CEK25_002843 [Fusarium fujikuroi]